MVSWGYEDQSADTVVRYASTFWSAILSILAFLICSKYYYSSHDVNLRAQRKLFAIGFGIPVFTYLITNQVFPILQIITPNLGHFAVLFFTIFCG